MRAVSLDLAGIGGDMTERQGIMPVAFSVFFSRRFIIRRTLPVFIG